MMILLVFVACIFAIECIVIVAFYPVVLYVSLETSVIFKLFLLQPQFCTNKKAA